MKKFFNGGRKFVWRGTVILGMTIILPICGWILLTVRDLPAQYPSKEEVKDDIAQVRQDHKEDMDRIENMIQQIYDHLIGGG